MNIRNQIYNNIKTGIWPGNQKLFSSNWKGDIYVISTEEGEMYVRVKRDVKGKEKVTWVS